MPFKAVQLTLTESTATACIVQGSGTTQFKNVKATLQDPIPVTIKNEDATNTIWWGGSNVDATHGQSILPGALIQMNLYSMDGLEIPYVYCATGTPIVSVVCGRQ